MRLTTSLRTRPVISRVSEASTHRSFATRPASSSPSPLLFICRRCSTSQEPKLIFISIKDRRWASTATSSSNEDFKSSSLPKTHYEFFPETLSKGPPPTGRFLIDLRKLRKEFLQLQAVAHPDRHPSSLKTRAEATSARINEAYKTLQNPLLRAQYLLSLRGMDVSEDETAKVDDPEFLMEVMDIREGIENSRDEKEIQDTRAENEQRISVSENILDDAFAREDLVTAQAEAVRLRYWVNIQESLGEWEEKMINETINSDEK